MPNIMLFGFVDIWEKAELRKGWGVVLNLLEVDLALYFNYCYTCALSLYLLHPCQPSVMVVIY